MGKRSDFERIERDYYRTFDPKAIQALKNCIEPGMSFIEPCAGDGILSDQLVNDMGLKLIREFDIEPQNDRIIKKDALTITEFDVRDAELLITNPPWDRKLLHPMIDKFSSLRPTWLLFDANWLFTRQARPYLKYCVEVVNIGRMKWIPDTTMAGKDDCLWYHFDCNHSGPTTYYPY